MSKTAKGLSAALIICVLAVVGGLFACKPLVEQAVRDALRNVNPDATICSIDTVDINPLSFTLKLGNIRISDQRTYDTVLKEATMTLSPRFVLACVPFLRDSILPAAGDAPLFSSATGRDLTEKSLIPGEPMTCTVEALTSGPVAMDAAVLKRLLNGQQVPEGEFMISIIAEKVTYGPVRISSTAPETPMQSSVAAVSIEGVDRRTWKRMTMDATEVIIRSEGAFKMGKLEIRDIFLPDGLVRAFPQPGPPCRRSLRRGIRTPARSPDPGSRAAPEGCRRQADDDPAPLRSADHQGCRHYRIARQDE